MNSIEERLLLLYLIQLVETKEISIYELATLRLKILLLKESL